MGVVRLWGAHAKAGATKITSGPKSKLLYPKKDLVYAKCIDLLTFECGLEVVPAPR